MSNIVKKLLAIIIILGLPFATCNPLIDVVEAKPKVIEKQGELNKYLKKEAKNRKTRLNESLEQELNHAGLFDDEIKNLDDETIGLLENGACFTVDIQYYMVSDDENTSQNNDLEDDKDSIIPLSDIEIDELIEEIYGEEIAEEAKCNVLESLGLIPITTYAASSTVYNDENNKQGYFKQTILIVNKSKLNGKRRAHVTYTGTWLTPPKTRYVDLFSVHMSNAKIYDNTVKAFYYYTENYIGSGGYTKEVKVDLSNNVLVEATNLNDIAAYFTLMRDVSSNTVGTYTRTKHSARIEFDVKEIDGAAFSASGQYYHQIATMSVGFKFSFKDRKVSFPTEIVGKMQQMTDNNVKVNYNFK